MQLDLTYLQTVSGGDADFIKDIMKLFLEHTMPDSVVLKQQIGAQDWPKVSSTAHKLKSSISMFGNQQMSERIISIEQSAKHSTGIELIPETFAALEKDLEWMAGEIRKYIAEH